MKIKDIIVRLNKLSITEIYENKFNIVDNINSIYVDKFIEKYSYTKEAIRTKKINDVLHKENQKMVSMMSGSLNKFLKIFFSINLLLTIVCLFFSHKSLTLPSFVFYSFLMLPASSLLLAFSFLVYESNSETKIKKNKNKIIKNSEKYINIHYKDFFSNITFELIKEIDLIKEPELQNKKEEIKNYLINRAYQLDKNENDMSEERDLAIKDEIINKMFIEDKQPLNNKKLENNFPNKSIDLEKTNDTNNILKKLKNKFNEKTPII